MPFRVTCVADGRQGERLCCRLILTWQVLCQPNAVRHTSGYSLDLADPRFAGGHGIYFLEKPYRSAQMLVNVRDCLDDRLATIQAA